MAMVRVDQLGPCPVGPETVVRPMFRASEGEPPIVSKESYKASQLRWDRFPGQRGPLPYDIIGYEVVAS